MEQELGEAQLEYRRGRQKQPYNGFAIAALASLLVAVLSVVVAFSLVRSMTSEYDLDIIMPMAMLIPLGSLAAVVTGGMALDSMARRPGITRGRRMAMVGIVGGGLMCLVQCLLVVVNL